MLAVPAPLAAGVGWRRKPSAGAGIRSGALGVGLAVLVACEGGGVFLPAAEPVEVGEIVAVGKDLFWAPRSSELTRVHIRAAGDECGIVFNVVPETVIAVTEEGRTRRGDLDDLRVGSFARGWTENRISLTCPGRALASAIEVVSETP